MSKKEDPALFKKRDHEFSTDSLKDYQLRTYRSIASQASKAIVYVPFDLVGIVI